MSFQFHVGQRVVCVDITPNKDGGLSPTWSDTRMPVEGGIYTIRRIYDARPFGHDDVALLLEEVRNRVRPYTSVLGHRVRCEQFFLGFRFRPVRRTSIEVFRKLLEPQDKVHRFTSAPNGPDIGLPVEFIGWAAEKKTDA